MIILLIQIKFVIQFENKDSQIFKIIFSANNDEKEIKTSIIVKNNNFS